MSTFNLQPIIRVLMVQETLSLKCYLTLVIRPADLLRFGLILEFWANLT